MDRSMTTERDLALTLTSYSRIVDLKELENHMLDRVNQMNDEVRSCLMM